MPGAENDLRRDFAVDGAARLRGMIDDVHALGLAVGPIAPGRAGDASRALAG